MRYCERYRKEQKEARMMSTEENKTVALEGHASSAKP
jgi:hypothetical protein